MVAMVMAMAMATAMAMVSATLTVMLPVLVLVMVVWCAGHLDAIGHGQHAGKPDHAPAAAPEAAPRHQHRKTRACAVHQRADAAGKERGAKDVPDRVKTQRVGRGAVGHEPGPSVRGQDDPDLHRRQPPRAEDDGEDHVDAAVADQRDGSADRNGGDRPWRPMHAWYPHTGRFGREAVSAKEVVTHLQSLFLLCVVSTVGYPLQSRAYIRSWSIGLSVTVTLGPAVAACRGGVTVGGSGVHDGPCSPASPVSGPTPGLSHSRGAQSGHHAAQATV